MPDTTPHVLQRLERMKRLANRAGFDVRSEPLASGLPTDAALNSSPTTAMWCELRGRRTLFLDAAQPANEQIEAIREILELTATFRPQSTGRADPSSSGEPDVSTQSRSSTENRAAA